MNRQIVMIAAVAILSACGDATGPGDEPAIIADATVRGTIQLRPVGGLFAMCTLRLKLQGDVTWTGGDMVTTTPARRDTPADRFAFDGAGLKSMVANGYDYGSGSWPWTATLTLDWKHGNTTGTVTHTYTCVTD